MASDVEERCIVLLMEADRNARIRDGIIATVEDSRRRRVHAGCVVEAHRLKLTVTDSDPSFGTLTRFSDEVRAFFAELFGPKDNIIQMPKRRRA